MNLVKYLSQSRGVGNSARRLGSISQRFGLSPARMRGALRELVDICEESGARPTLAVTACLIERNPDFFRSLAARKVDLAVHGFVHTDHALLDEQAQYEHLSRALEAFAPLGLAPKGFRHPYLRFNDDTWRAAARLGFTHSSNSSVHWDVVQESLPPEALTAYMKGLRLYGSEPESQRMSLPRTVSGGILDVPASLPDDEAVIDRLGLHGRNAGIFWLRTLDRTYDLGEAMTLVVHNERVPMCANSLRALLRLARSRSPHVWIATLSEINDWWRQRASWNGRVESAAGGAEGEWRVTPPSDPEAAVLVRDAETEPAGVPWFGRWRMMPPREFTIRSNVAPMLSLDDAPESARTFLRTEGYAIAEGAEGALHLETPASFGPTDERALTETIEASSHPLVRLWRWPRGARSALAITSDVDAMTLFDFLRRPLEV